MVILVVLVGCSSPDYTQAQKGEANLPQLYEAMGDERYPLTKPVFVACDYFRVSGEAEQRPLGEVLAFTADPAHTDLGGPSSFYRWAQLQC